MFPGAVIVVRSSGAGIARGGADGILVRLRDLLIIVVASVILRVNNLR